MSYTPPTLLRAIPLAVIAASVMLVSGCSSSSSSNKDDNTQKSVAITGSAIKGTLIGAEVQACILADCTGENDPIATATTKEDGSYTLDAKGAESSTVVLRVRYKTGATMVCDVPTGCGTDITFGTAYSMPKALTLRSVASVDPSATTISAHITPITELVTAAAIQSRSGLGQLSSDSITKGSDAVRALLGLEKGTLLTQIKPVDVTKAAASDTSDEALQISLLGAAFADANSDNVMQKINDMSKAVAGGSVAQATLESLTTLAQVVLEKAPVAAAKKESIKTGLDTAKTKATEKCNAEGCSSAPEQSEVSDAELNKLSKNVAAIKLLVEDVRTLGWEVIPQLENTLDNTNSNSNYDENNLFAQIDEAKTLFNKGNGVTANGSGAIASDALVAVAERLVDGYTKCKTECPTNLTGIDTDLGTAEDITWTNDTVTKTGNTWSVNEAKYTQNTQEATVSVSITFPETTDLGTNGSGDLTGTLNKNALLRISASSQSGNASIILTEGTLTAVLSDNLDLAAYDAEVTIESLTFKVTNAKVSNSATNVSFTGNLTLEAGTSAKQKGINPNSADAVLPKSINLKGVFAGTGTENLEAELNFNFDSFDNFSYYVDGQSIDGLLNFTQSNNGKTLTTVLGDASNKATYIIDYQQGEPHPELVFSCTSVGDSYCPWRAHDNQPEVLYDYEAQQSYSGPQTVIDALEFLLYSNPWARLSWYFEMEARHSLYGWLQVPEDLTISQITSNSAKAFADDVRESDDNHVLFTTSAKVNGKLSANLPEMAIGLEVKRTARFAANAKLTLDWDSDTNKKQLVLSASSVGTSEQSMEDNIVLKISDKAGTSLDLVLIDRISTTDTVVGTISKDGTKYATITEEGSNRFFVTYHYDDTGKKADVKSQEFKSLF